LRDHVAERLGTTLEALGLAATRKRVKPARLGMERRCERVEYLKPRGFDSPPRHGIESLHMMRLRAIRLAARVTVGGCALVS